jgi:hypothetical protein
MQIAGNRCRVCAGQIIFANEGKVCVHCGDFVHVMCEQSANCAVCGRPFQNYLQPTPNPLREAILPRALRAPKSGGPEIALVVGLVFLLFGIVASFPTWLMRHYR